MKGSSTATLDRFHASRPTRHARTRQLQREATPPPPDPVRAPSPVPSPVPSPSGIAGAGTGGGGPEALDRGGRGAHHEGATDAGPQQPHRRGLTTAQPALQARRPAAGGLTSLCHRAHNRHAGTAGPDARMSLAPNCCAPSASQADAAADQKARGKFDGARVLGAKQGQPEVSAHARTHAHAGAHAPAYPSVLACAKRIVPCRPLSHQIGINCCRLYHYLA